MATYCRVGRVPLPQIVSAFIILLKQLANYIMLSGTTTARSTFLFSSYFSLLHCSMLGIKIRFMLSVPVMLYEIQCYTGSYHDGIGVRDWSRSVGSYGNNTLVMCCPAPRRPESSARRTSLPDNKSRGCCCRNSRPTVINPDYNMTK